MDKTPAVNETPTKEEPTANPTTTEPPPTLPIRCAPDTDHAEKPPLEELDRPLVDDHAFPPLSVGTLSLSEFFPPQAPEGQAKNPDENYSNVFYSDMCVREARQRVREEYRRTSTQKDKSKLQQLHEQQLDHMRQLHDLLVDRQILERTQLDEMS